MTEHTSTRTPAAAALTATVGLAAASWVVAARLMNGMDMGVPRSGEEAGRRERA